MNRKLLDEKLVSEWRAAWKLWSMRLNAVASVLVAYVLASPDVLLNTLNQLPPEMRAVFPPLAGFALFAVVSAARLWKQGNGK